MIFSIREFVDVLIMTGVVGFIFKDLFKQVDRPFLFSCLVTAPALILHELAHKFIALGFGLQATFHAAYFWLVLGIIMKLANFGFIFFVPAYVSIDAVGAQLTPLSSALVAGSGPFTNLALFGIAWAFLQQKKLKTRTYIFLQVTKQINLFLFVFNMLPLPMFDGLKFYQGILQVLF